MQFDELAESLPVLQRLALAYAPRVSRNPTLALFALDTRLANILRSASEPMLAQLRLAWWRENLIQDAAAWPAGEPLLAALSSWNGSHTALEALVDGWEAMTGAAPLETGALQTLCDGRGAAFAALAQVVGAGSHRDAARSLGSRWAAADLATHLTDPVEVERAVQLAGEGEAPSRGLPRNLRPLVVLHGLTQRTLKRSDAGKGRDLLSLAAGLRLGLFGR